VTVDRPGATTLARAFLARAIGTGSVPALAALAACTAPSLPPAPIRPAAQAHILLERRFEDPGLLRFVQQALGRTDHGSDTGQAAQGAAPDVAPVWNLERLTLAAIYFHPDLQVAHSQLQLALSHAVNARARPAPSWSAMFGRGAGAAVAAPWVVGAAVEFLLEPGGRRRWEIAQADELVTAARADVRQAGWQVRARVYAALVDQWDAQRRIEPLREQLRLQSRRVELIERRIDAGEAPRAESRRELALRDQCASALAQAETDLARARVQLAQAIGVPAAALDSISVPIDWMDRIAPIDTAAVEGPLRTAALNRRTDIVAALARIDAAQDDLQAELTRRWPDLRVGPGYQFDLGANKYTVSAAVDWPRSTEGPVGEALARRDLAVAELLGLQAALIAQVDRALSEWRSATDAAPALLSALARAEQGERAAQDQFDAGGLDRPALLAARIDRLEAARLGRSALVRQRRALALLEDALQSPLEAGQPVPETLAAGAAPERSGLQGTR